MRKCNLDGCLSAYGKSKVYIAQDDLTDFEIWERLEEGIQDRCERNFGDDEWEYYETDNVEIKKISYRVNHMDDGWGCIMFKNGSGYSVDANLTINGQNIGTCTSIF